MRAGAPGRATLTYSRCPPSPSPRWWCRRRTIAPAAFQGERTVAAAAVVLVLAVVTGALLLSGGDDGDESTVDAASGKSAEVFTAATGDQGRMAA